MPFAPHGTPIYLRSGELQYFRVRRELWRPALMHLRDADFNAVSTYVPWILHEPAEGEFDFEGRAGDYTNLFAFLDACRDAGMPVMIRPGPQIYAEFDGFGLPKWLGRRYPECVMRRPNGKMVKGSYYYFYSMLHPVFLAKVELWLAAVVAALWPRYADVVISFQLDNETGMPLANTVGNLDFNADTVARYRAFLRRRYADEGALRDAWGARGESFATALPPRRPASAGCATDWFDFFEAYVAEYMATLRDLAEKLHVPAPLVVNDLNIYLSPASPGAKRGIAQVQGYDIYTKGSGTSSTADFPFAPSSDPERFRALIGEDTTFVAVEMGTSWFDPRARVCPEATVQATLGGVAHGLEGHSYYVAHDGRDPDGSPYTWQSFFDEAGHPLERLTAVAGIHRFLARHERDLLASRAEYDPVLYLTYQPYSRLMPDEYLPGHFLPDPLLYLTSLGLQGFYDVLLTAGFLPQFADLQRVSAEELGRARVVFFPTKGWVDRASLAKLVAYVEGGGHLVTFPTVVSRDDHGHAVREARLFPRGERRHRHIGYGTVAWRLAIDLFGKYALFDRWRLQRRAPAAMQNTDSFEGLKVLLNQKLPAVSVRTREGARMRGDYVASVFEAADGQDAVGRVREDLQIGGACGGYTVELAGGGSSTVVGTAPGGAYTTGVYYKLAPSEREALRGYARALLRERGVEPGWTSGLDIECVLRRVSPTSAFLFVINRLGPQRGSVTFTPDHVHWTSVNVVFTHRGSTAILCDTRTLALELGRDDVLIVQLLDCDANPTAT